MNALHFLGNIFGLLLFPTWLFLAISAWWFARRVAPRALKAWCEQNGLEVAKKWNPWLFNLGNPFRDYTSMQEIFKITVRDQKARARTGWMRIGSRRWFSYSVDQCPVEVQWDDAGAASAKKTTQDVDPDWAP